MVYSELISIFQRYKYFRFSTSLVPEKEGVYRTVLGYHPNSHHENPHRTCENEGKDYLFSNIQNRMNEANQNPTSPHPAELVIISYFTHVSQIL